MREVQWVVLVAMFALLLPLTANRLGESVHQIQMRLAKDRESVAVRQATAVNVQHPVIASSEVEE